MLVIFAKDFDENTPISCGIMTFQNFWNFLQLFDRFRIAHSFVQIDSHKGHRGIAQNFWIDDKFGARNQSRFFKFAQPLMDGCTRNTNLTCDFQNRRSCILHQSPKNFFIDTINFKILIDYFHILSRKLDARSLEFTFYNILMLHTSSFYTFKGLYRKYGTSNSLKWISNASNSLRIGS